MMVEDSCEHEQLTENKDEFTNENNEFKNVSDDDIEPIIVIKKRIVAFSDSDSDKDTVRKNILKSVSVKNTSASSSDETSHTCEPKKYESFRTESKKKRLKDKFKKLKTKKIIIEAEDVSEAKNKDSDEEISCRKIIEEVKRSAYSMKSICDPDTSDEEDNSKLTKYKNKHKAVRSTSPKPLRMSAKQAMENMQKIKSESNRMLREREISLPYHRPKALSLKDIMSRRKPAVSSDGKALPIKMSKDQLKQYVTMLEQRQKEVIELCKSESEDDNLENDEGTYNKMSENTIPKDNSTTENEKNELNCINEKFTENDVNNIEENNISKDTGRQEIVHSDLQEKSWKNNTITEITSPMQTEEKQVIETESGETSLLQYSNENDVQMNTSYIEQNELPINVTYNAENESEIMTLHYGSEANTLIEKKNISIEHSSADKTSNSMENSDNEFMENDFHFDEISKIIDEAELNGHETLKQTTNFQANAMPKLTGCPGSLIDLDDTSAASQTLSGVEMLKQRFTYFAKLKSLDEIEKERERKYKPGAQHLKLKLELEQQIAEQRSLEWEKRLEEENKLKAEMNVDMSDDEIDKMEAKLTSETKEKNEDSSESEEEPIENDIILEDKPKKRNPMVDDEAEVSECDEVLDNNEDDDVYEDEHRIDDVDNMDDNRDLDSESSDSSESEDETEGDKPRKGRILKAFEDSDDEINDEITSNTNRDQLLASAVDNKTTENDIKESQDDDLQLAQTNKSSQDLFFTQESNNNPNSNVINLNRSNEGNASSDLGTQSFSIMNSAGLNPVSMEHMSPDKLLEIQSQQLNIESEGPSQILMTSQYQSQEIGDDIAALCTGKFYDNPFVSLDQNTKNAQKSNQDNTDNMSDVLALCTGKFYDNQFVSQCEGTNVKDKENNVKRDNDANDGTDKMNTPETSIDKEIGPVAENNIFKSVLDELDGPDEAPKKNKYFFNSSQDDNLKKKFIINSDDETNDNDTHKRVKKLKKRKAEQRALQISDDEDDEVEYEQDESEIEENENKIVEYDSEENEVEIQTKPLKKKKHLGEFFENEAELTSEDEWMGSGDEDERGLDLMEREEGDDETFQQDQLQRELGQIHMREVLDQDKREVRLIQELLFEDGDLGDGHRQRKFRWRNADGEIETGTNPNEFLDTQEDDFESEEQWRKQRHEREMFLRQMQEKDEDLNTSINRTTIIKANLNSRSMSTLITETKTDKIVTTDAPDPIQKKKNNKDIPSPKKPFIILQQNYHSSLLTRGRGALARLAALATPLATDDDTPKAFGSTNRGNFVFTSITPDDKPKVTKRKAESNVGTPRLIKKIKTDETSKYLKSSLFDHLKT